jgi:WbqC-like protein
MPPLQESNRRARLVWLRYNRRRLAKAMKAVVHQPMYLPYPGFFHKLSLADIFVIMDDVQYDKRFTNRNRILDPQGPQWLTVPINKAHKFSPNNQVQINNALPWRETHWKKICASYANADYFPIYREYFEALYSREWRLLFDLDLETIRQLMDWLGIKIPIIRESELNVQGTGTQRLINACKAIGVDTYISGRGGKEYMDEKLFAVEGVRLEYQNYTPTPYPQRFTNTFVPDLSILDMLSNIGPGSTKLISGQMPLNIA